MFGAAMTQILHIKKIKKIQRTKFVNNFEKLIKMKRGASVEDEILHGE